MTNKDLTENENVPYHITFVLCKPMPRTAVKIRSASSTHKKVVVGLADRSSIAGYFNPARLAIGQPLDILTAEGERRSIEMRDVRAVYFVRDFTDQFEPERRSFFSRPKLDGLWVRLTFHDQETIEGVIPNDLLSLLDSGVQITPPDTTGATLRIFVPRASLAALTVLGVVGVARRQPAASAPAQPKLFSE
jgi:hypothetical protein